MLHFHVTGAHAISDESEKSYWRRVLQNFKKNTTPRLNSQLSSQLAALHSQCRRNLTWIKYRAFIK